MISSKQESIRENFPDFIEYMNQQNNHRTVTEIWEAIDDDPFTKMALQWEIQDPRQPTEMSIEDYDSFLKKRTIPVAADLRRLDAFLKSLRGTEILIQIDDPSKGIHFTGLTTVDGGGLDFIQGEDPNSPYKNVVLGSRAASSENIHYGEAAHINVASGLRIPFEAREVLRTKDSKDWDGYGNHKFPRTSSLYKVPFDPNNSFPAIMTKEELNRHREDTGVTTALDSAYEVLKKAIDKSSSGVIVKT